MYTKDAAFRPGQSITIQVSNKPYIDHSIPPESNDYRWASYATIDVYDPEDSKIISTSMARITGKIGWYFYRLQTSEASIMGQYRVVVRLATPSGDTITPGTSGTSGTPPTSGNPDNLVDVKVSYFNLMDLY